MDAVIVDRNFHLSRNYGVASNGEFVQALIDQFGFVLVSGQKEYDRLKRRIRRLFITLEPLSQSVKIDSSLHERVGLWLSDPHDARWPEKFRSQHLIDDKGVGLIFCPYQDATPSWIPGIEERLVFFPWFVKNEWVIDKPIFYGHAYTHVMGSWSNMPEYAVRRWVANFPFVRRMSHQYTGHDYRRLVGMKYFDWLSRHHDSIVTGTGWKPAWGYVVAKCFEVPARGLLLIAQDMADMRALGFEDGVNCLLFNRENFEAKTSKYLESPREYVDVRERGIELVRERHLMSHRLELFHERMIEDA